MLRPNQSVTVAVRVCKGTPVKITLGGTGGTALPVLQDARQNTPTNHPELQMILPGSDTRGAAASAITATRVFAARVPSSTPIPLDITVGTNTDPYEQELIIVSKISGALRIGLGTVFGANAVPRGYEAYTPPGSSTQIAAQTSGGTAAFELVLGVAPYLLDLAFWGGRSYENQENAYFAPYIGLGVLSVDTSSVSAFTTLYNGIEFEPIPSVSIVAAFAIRRVDRLGGGLHAGSPIENGTIPIRHDFGFGPALVINAAPNIFQFGPASSSGSSQTPSPGSAGTTSH
jgi:hypothetical protein